MKKNDLKKEVALLEQINEIRKAKIHQLSFGANLMKLIGITLIIIFTAHLIITHYILLGMVSTLLYLTNMELSGNLIGRMSSQFFGLFLLCIMGLFLLLLAKISYRRKQELSK